jgi:O-antigen/teichoic acid export membrane protein
MNNRSRALVRNVSYTLIANITSFLLSTLVVILLPKLLAVQDYGYLQLFLFFSSYVGFFQFGWNDGIYLRYGGKKYEDLDKTLFFSQFWSLTVSQICLASAMIVLVIFMTPSFDRQLILSMTALSMVSHGVRCMLLFILQATNRIREYAKITIFEKIIYLIIMILMLAAGVRTYTYLMFADLVCKFTSLVFAMILCKDMVFLKLSSFRVTYSETWDNMRVGVKLMIANIASMLVIGIVRFGIEKSWDVATFGKISLTLSMSNLMLLFINAVGIVLFPILRRASEDHLSDIYTSIRNLLMALLLGSLAIYYPLKIVMMAWLPHYEESLIYMALIFPLCVFEGKMSLLINTYLKTIRQEKLMLRVNLVALVISALITYVTTMLLRNLDLAVFSIVLLLAFRCIYAEYYLSKLINFSFWRDMFLELSMALVFISSSWYLGNGLSMLIYSLAFAVYLVVKRKDMSVTLKAMKAYVA